METLSQFIARKIDDPALRDSIMAELHWRGMDRNHGLIFEDSVEELDTPTRAPQAGRRVQLRHAIADKRRFQVVSLNGNSVTAVPMQQAEDGRTWLIPPNSREQAFDMDDLLSVVSHTETVFPGLASTGSIGPCINKPSHLAISGENLHVLRALGYSHSSAVDLIYIDPPYNTGTKDWVYNDRRIDSSDGFRHGKWLAFMHRRLELAKDLLKDTGIIIVAIGDDEHHRLRMLLDDVLGEQNFIANLTWQGQGSSLSRATQGGVDYMLVYARDKDVHFERRGKWRDPKTGSADLLQEVGRLWEHTGHDVTETQAMVRRWIRKNSNSLDAGVKLYNQIDCNGDVFRGLPLDAEGGKRYDVVHPVTKRPVPIPSRGWAPAHETMTAHIAKGEILFGPDETTIPQLKRRLSDAMEQLPLPTFSKSRDGTKHLRKVLAAKTFPNPKDIDVLMRWFRIAAPDDAVVFDFFAGSGSTLEAVLRLNEEDGGSRQCIVATNNELSEAQASALAKTGYGPGDPQWEAAGVFQHVLRPRINAVLTGLRPDGSTYDKVIHGEHRVEFFQLDYMDDEGDLDTYIDYELMAPLLWARAGGSGPIPEQPEHGQSVIGERFAILFDVDKIADLVERLRESSKVDTLFIVAGSNDTYRQSASDVTSRLPQRITTIHLEQTYLQSRTWIPRDRLKRVDR